jgi:hypothetical protein
MKIPLDPPFQKGEEKSDESSYTPLYKGGRRLRRRGDFFRINFQVIASFSTNNYNDDSMYFYGGGQ